MAEYQVIARKFRPKLFKEVVGQEATVATLMGAIRRKRVAHAYLFSGARGTGKTTLARLFAKSLNCAARDESTCEPCNECSSCREIDAFCSMDVLEIDGASHRGIEDVRGINETIIYAPTHGKYKIYIIDEVHMLTKEAFNALLKSLEEPPEKVKFFFATTEAHKIPATILSRCQHFRLNRIPLPKMEEKLKSIAAELGVETDKGALELIAELSGGGLRDAESFLDQVISFYGKKVTREGVSEFFGLLPKMRFEELDRAFVQDDVSIAFKIADEVFKSGASPEFFIEELIGHFREILLGKKQGPYSKERCMAILEGLSEVENQIRHAFSAKTMLEMSLLKIIRSRKKMAIEDLVERLLELEGRLNSNPLPNPSPSPSPTPNLQISPTAEVSMKEKSRFDTVTRFAAKELGGSLKKE